MKKIVIGLAIALVSMPAWAGGSQRVNGYFNSKGTYVMPYTRTAPDSSVWNNYSTQGNYNPYTGQAGTVNPYNTYTQPTYQYQQPNYQYRPRTYR